ncbi:MAG: hypothetical protein KAS32_30015 [Candidatus Peribacteraceae bacterium]|nr:hypothetical protein [Candidatus Peribacteraceae bacterium]
MKSKDRVELIIRWLALENQFIPEEQQTCQYCGKPMKHDFVVSDKVWNEIMMRRNETVVCFECFDEFAHRMNIDYVLNGYYLAGKRNINFHIREK